MMNENSYSPFSRRLLSSNCEDFFGLKTADHPNLHENVCRICNIKLKTRGILENHLDFEHFKEKLENLVEGNGSPYTCSKCPMTSKVKWYVAKHIVAKHISNEHGLRDQLIDEELGKDFWRHGRNTQYLLLREDGNPSLTSLWDQTTKQ